MMGKCIFTFRAVFNFPVLCQVPLQSPVLDEPDKHGGAGGYREGRNRPLETPVLDGLHERWGIDVPGVAGDAPVILRERHNMDIIGLKRAVVATGVCDVQTHVIPAACVVSLGICVHGVLEGGERPVTKRPVPKERRSRREIGELNGQIIPAACHIGGKRERGGNRWLQNGDVTRFCGSVCSGRVAYG